MKLFKEISLKNIFVSSLVLFTSLIFLITVISVFGKFREKKIYQLESNYALLRLNQTELVEYQDNMFLFNSDVYFMSSSYYKKFDLKISSNITIVDSILEYKVIRAGLVIPILENLKEQYVAYNSIVQEITEINSEVYLPGVGINYRSNFIKNNLLKNEKYSELNLLQFVDSINFYKNQLFKDNITKREFQKKSNFFISKISTLSNSNQDRYFYLLFEDQLSEYYNNAILEYTKHKTIGNDYNEGLLNNLRFQNYYIDEILDELSLQIIQIRKNNFNRTISLYIFASLLVIVLNLLIFKYIYDTIYSPWKKIEPLFYQISIGSFPEVESITTLNEFKNITDNLNLTVNKLKDKNEFINKLAEKNYEINFETNEKDVLGQSLLKLKDRLIVADKEAVQFRETEENQKWAANGIAKIGAIMRQFTEDLNVLSKNILREIIDYVDAVQGVIFIHNREEGFLEQVASFSYGKSRQKNTKILPYEGLIGTILVEKREYFYDYIPNDYIFLETGFGYAKPKSLFAFPLLFESSIYGIIEIASLEVIPEYKRNFLLTLANEIAITISYTEINVRTKELFEQSIKQAKELKSNEKLFKKNQDNLKSLLRMTEDHLNDTLHSLKMKEKLVKEKIEDLLAVEKELSSKEEYIENITNEYENIKSSLENQNSELRKRVEELEKRLRGK